MKCRQSITYYAWLSKKGLGQSLSHLRKRKILDRKKDVELPLARIKETII